MRPAKCRNSPEISEAVTKQAKGLQQPQISPKHFTVAQLSTRLPCKAVKTHGQYHVNAADPRCHANNAAAAKSDATGKCRAAHAPSPIHHSTANTFMKARQL
jgi:hypothetical protein